MKPINWVPIGIGVFLLGGYFMNNYYEGRGFLLMCLGGIMVIGGGFSVLRRITTKSRMREKMEIREELTGDRILPEEKDAAVDGPQTIGEKWEESRKKDLKAESKKKLAEHALDASGNELASELEKLAKLREDGILSEEEFIAAKAKLLG